MTSFPTYPQHDAMDCGPTCLRILAKHYGKTYSLEGLRERAHLTRLGVSMLGIAEAAENIGFRTMGVKISIEKLQEAPLPCIVHWNQNHVSDPSAGLVKYTWEEFGKYRQASK